MRLLILFCMLLLACPVYASGLTDEEILDIRQQTAPQRNLFLDRFAPCEGCESYVLVFSRDPVSRDMLEGFKHIANSLGKKHGGAILRESDIIASSEFLSESRCNLSVNSPRFIIFIDTRRPKCFVFNISQDDVLAVALADIYMVLQSGKDVGEAKLIRDLNQLIQNAESKYAVEGIFKIVVDLVNYIIEEYKRSQTD